MSRKNDDYNRARNEKMRTHDCWECEYFPDMCNPLRPCKKENNHDKEDK